MSAPAADFPAGSVELRLKSLLAGLERLRNGSAAMGWAELRKLRHDHLDIFTRSVQPLLWLFIFGTALRRNRALSGGFHDYRAYLAPGVMAQAALFISIFFGLAVIWERDVGQLQRLLATPIPRLGIVLGKATGAGIRALTQAVVLLAVLAVAGIAIPLEPARRAGRARLARAGHRWLRLPFDDPRLTRTHARTLHGHRPARDDAALLRLERPLPTRDHAGVATRRARINPLTYEVHGMRQLLVGISAGGTLWIDFAVGSFFLVAAAGIAAKTYPRAIL